MKEHGKWRERCSKHFRLSTFCFSLMNRDGCDFLVSSICMVSNVSLTGERVCRIERVIQTTIDNPRCYAIWDTMSNRESPPRQFPLPTTSTIRSIALYPQRPLHWEIVIWLPQCAPRTILTLLIYHALSWVGVRWVGKDRHTFHTPRLSNHIFMLLELAWLKPLCHKTVCWHRDST